jgi:hypothetical protein
MSEGFLEPQERVELEKEEPEIVAPKPRIKDVVLSNIEDSLGEIKDYYKINKEQARSSFKVSVIAMSVGFMVVVLGILLFYLYGYSGVGISSITVITSAFLNFMGGAYFYLYKESISRLNDFHDKLVRIQETMLAITLCDQIQENGNRDRIKEHLIKAIIKRTTRGRSDSSMNDEVTDLKKIEL